MSWICQQLEHSREWFYKWWNRYQEDGANGLRDRSRAPQNSPQRWSGEMRQAILDVRDQLMRRRGPRERYRLAGAATIRHELACLGYDPLPSLRTIVRILESGGRTSPAFRPSAFIGFPEPVFNKPDVVVDVTDFWEQRQEAIRCFRSQVLQTGEDDRGSKTFVRSQSFWDLQEAHDSTSLLEPPSAAPQTS